MVFDLTKLFSYFHNNVGESEYGRPQGGSITMDSGTPESNRLDYVETLAYISATCHFSHD